MNIYLVYEDQISAVLLRKLFLEILTGNKINFIELGNHGRGYIEKNINDFNNLRKDLIFFILIDLDNDKCAPELISNLLKKPLRENLMVRIAVREVESWLLADIKSFSNYINLSFDYIKKEVNSPDLLKNPKEKLISLVKRSKKRELKNDIVRIDNTSIKQGPGYNSRLTEYINNYWNIENAITKSESLYRTVKAISKFKEVVK